MDVTQAPEGPVAGATSGMGETTTGGTCWSTDLFGWHGGREQPGRAINRGERSTGESDQPGRAIDDSRRRKSRCRKAESV